MPRKKPKASQNDLKARIGAFLRNEARGDSFKVRVQLGVGGDESIVEEIKSHLTRGLNLLGDVIVTDTHPRYRILVNGLNASPPLLAVVFTETLDLHSGSFHGSTLKTILSGNLNEAEMAAVEGLASEHDLFVNLLVITGQGMKLVQLCEELIKRFDRQMVQPLKQCPHCHGNRRAEEEK